jgi:hypothetical protein
MDMDLKPGSKAEHPCPSPGEEAAYVLCLPLVDGSRERSGTAVTCRSVGSEL